MLAQWLDNDEDGVPDCPAALARMVADDASLVMTGTEGREELAGVYSQFGPGVLSNSQGLGADETVPGGIAAAGRYDAAVEEILHLVSQKGYGRVFPDLDDSKFVLDNRLSAAMDAARGGHFPGGFPRSEYPASCWYSYDDVTCTYGCQKTEYLYWLLTSYLGGQDEQGRGAAISPEWKLNTRAKLVAGSGGVGPDTLGVALLEDPRYSLPTKKLPDGKYLGPTVSRHGP